MQLVLDTNGLMVKKKNQAFWIVAKAGRRLISPHRVSSIAVTADCLLSAAAIRLAAQHGIPIYFFDGAGKARARLWSPGFGSIATIRREQIHFAARPEATAWVLDLFAGKVRQQAANLRYLGRRRPSQADRLQAALTQLDAGIPGTDSLVTQPIAACRSQLLGQEGSLARAYWQAVGASLPAPWTFGQRSRRPARDPFNAGLNYLYGMLYNTVSQAALAAGLDTHLGVLHVDQYARPTLVFDLIEPFRPWADRLLIQACLEHRLKPSHFDEKEGTYVLNRAGKHFLIPLFNAEMEVRHRFRQRQLRQRDHIYQLANDLAQHLLAGAATPDP